MAVLVFSRNFGNFRENHDTNFRLKAKLRTFHPKSVLA